MSTPDLHLQTAYVLNEKGRMVSTREPDSRRCPLFILVRSYSKCAWAASANLSEELANKLSNLAREEPPLLKLRDVPIHAEKYLSLVRGRIESGPAFIFPDTIPESDGVVFIEDLLSIAQNFKGWTASEIAGRLPIAAILDDGYAVSICFCARRSDLAAEAGVETSTAFRGRGFGPRVTAAWALAVLKSGRVPLYSTSWINEASLAVTRKLGLIPYASTWSILDFKPN